MELCTVSNREAANRMADFVLRHSPSLTQCDSPSCSRQPSVPSSVPSSQTPSHEHTRTPGERLRAQMTHAARARAYQEAHRLLDLLWTGSEHGLIEAPLLLWAAQRRTTGARLWWGQQERLGAVAMLERALSMNTLDAASDNKARELLAVVRRANQMHAGHHPVSREMAALQKNITSWMLSANSELNGWERPSTSSHAPAHIRKMLKRYDTLRALLLKTAQDALAAGKDLPDTGPLPSVPEASHESTPRSAEMISHHGQVRVLDRDEDGEPEEDYSADEHVVDGLNPRRSRSPCSTSTYVI
jgi:hypothetical protein